ncbi:hypothetical protein A5819_001827 [Enterococcus sp. 7E2_DIV0204]|uniref:bacterial Ig-like domain-containing protein n=1 Tax=unclassified Enterococcus TaxID=2608891 RepID=UPI000A355FA2|nr:MULTISPECIES: bacterial Ig-like domain-containing protein [unclassified Enterococcus]OTN89335.1 hypothetical protein A5819_001827 [Enterococcus sp. 7E2_DIV0204]OTP51788.1 hypothetical protein A5884_000983 [Enterococcus sp. 7D2_DIV0200]
MILKKVEAVGYGKTTGVELSKQLNDQSVNIGDIIEVYHKEASKRVIRYNDDNKISTDKETYYYRIEKDQWVEVSDPTNQTSIHVKDSIVYSRDKWESEDNFVSATDKDGNVVPFSTVTVTGTVDTTKPGVYEVTYANGERTKVAVITVKENQESLNMKDSMHLYRIQI